jgi:uncharacterized protein YjbI with pentapeptide repeats
MTQPPNFYGQNLQSRSFYSKNLSGADFRKADIRGCRFHNTNLEGADFSEAITGKTGLKTFTDNSLKVINSINQFNNLINPLERRADFDIDETGTSFKDAQLSNAKFIGTSLENCDFTNAQLEQIDWTGAKFLGCVFSGNLADSIVRDLCVSRDGTNKNLSDRNLSGLNLVGVNISGANLEAANLNGANFSKADLGNTNLSNVQAIKTNFTNADLSGACIKNWAITPETIFTGVVCSHFFQDSNKTERKPASGFLNQGDFEKLVIQSTKSLDFLFRDGIDTQAFNLALDELIKKFGTMEISIKALEDLGGRNRLVRLNTVSDAPKAEMHAQFTEDYQVRHLQLEASRSKVRELQQELALIDLKNDIKILKIKNQLDVAMARLEERPTTQFIQNLLYYQISQLGQQIVIDASNSTYIDTMTNRQNQININESTDLVLNTGDNNQGVIGKISGIVTNTIQQLRETNQPEATSIAELLEQLQEAVESSAELAETDKEKALGYLNQIGEISAKELIQNKGMLTMLLDAFTGVISKVAPLIEPVRKIVEAILGIWKD